MARMNDTRDPLRPIFTAHLFPKLEAKLIELLHGLAPEDWEMTEEGEFLPPDAPEMSQENIDNVPF